MSTQENTIQVIIDTLDVSNYVLVQSGIKIQRTLHNKGMSVIDTARFTLKNSPTLAKFLIDRSNKDLVPVSINNNNSTLFTGYLRRGLSIDVKGHYAPGATTIDVEVLDKIEALNIGDAKQTVYRNKSYRQVVRDIIKKQLPSSEVDLSAINSTKILEYVKIVKDKTLQETIDAIIFPLRMVMYCDEAGVIRFQSWQARATTQHLNDAVVFSDAIQFSQRAVQARGVEVEWHSTKTLNDYQLYFVHEGSEEGLCRNHQDEGFMLGQKNHMQKNERENEWELLEVDRDSVRVRYDAYFDLLQKTGFMGWGGDKWDRENGRTRGEKKIGDTPIEDESHVDHLNWNGGEVEYKLDIKVKELDGLLLKFFFCWDKMNNKQDDNRVGSHAKLWITANATFRRVEKTESINIEQKHKKKLKGYPVYSQNDAQQLARTYQALLDNSGHSFSFAANTRLALGDVWNIDLPIINTKATIRVRKRQEMISPDTIIYKYECEKIQPLDKSVKLVSTYIQEVVIPQKIEETFATVDDLTQKINNTLASDVGGGSSLNVNVSVNNRDITLRVYHDQDNKKWSYKYEMHDGDGVWDKVEESTDRIFVYAVTQSEQDKTYFFRVSGFIADDTSGQYLVSPTVSATVKKITFDDLDDNLKVNNLDVKGDLIVRGTETKVNTTNLNIKDQMIDINVGETGNGVSGRHNGKKIAGTRVKRGSNPDTVLAYNEDTDNWEVDGAAIGTIYPIGFVYTQYPWELPPQSGRFLYSYVYTNHSDTIVYSDTTEDTSVAYLDLNNALNHRHIRSGDIKTVELHSGKIIPMHKSPRQSFRLGEVKFYHLSNPSVFYAWNHKGKPEVKRFFKNCECGSDDYNLFGHDYYDIKGPVSVNGPDLNFQGRWIIFSPYRNNGAFFRSEGGNAKAFGGDVQKDAGREIYGTINLDVQGGSHVTGAFKRMGGSIRGAEGRAWGQKTEFRASRSWGDAHTKNEFRPRNLTMRLWRRIG